MTTEHTDSAGRVWTHAPELESDYSRKTGAQVFLTHDFPEADEDFAAIGRQARQARGRALTTEEFAAFMKEVS